MSSGTDAREREAQRQQALMAALWGRPGLADALLTHERGARRERGLAAYRGNADAVAERALAAAFPTVAALVGEADFAHLAHEFRHAHPPERGDLGEWGAALPGWLQEHAGLTAWPYLGDCARLDLARHRCERAADASLDADSLGLLASAEPGTLRLQLVPGCALLESGWPIATILAAHQADAAHADAAFAVVRAALDAKRGESVLVARRGWRADVHALAAADLRWVRALLAGTDLAEALAQAGDDFDFAAWLARALQAGWVQGVAPISD